MIIHNGFVLLLLRKLCVWQILQKGDPQFLPPPRYDTYDRYDNPPLTSVSNLLNEVWFFGVGVIPPSVTLGSLRRVLSDVLNGYGF